MSPFSFPQLVAQPVANSPDSSATPLAPPTAEAVKFVPAHLKLTGEDAGLDCPSCNAATQLAEAGEFLVVACPQCFGFFSQSRNFNSIIEGVRKRYRGIESVQPLDAAQLRVARTCPACQNRFETHAYAGPGTTVVDSCANCRTVWLDGGELERIERAPGRR
ncbi:MAG: zf-TFIIB domain-containing protein [Planctomycetaceae bacterium]|nr:zf-TFIIB domain-containing protein [Planctomycetaceae bacterium]